MAMSHQFVVASHTLAALSLLDDRSVTSELLAVSVNTNATFIRQILSQLRDAGLVTSQRGPTGGFSLSRDPDQISLLAVYQALDDDRLLTLPDHDPHPQCPIGTTIRPAMEEALAPAEEALQESFAEISIEQLATEIEHRTTDQELQQVIGLAEASD